MKTKPDKKDDHFKTEEPLGVYELLPRFVDELPKAGKHNIMPDVRREFEYNGRRYVLTIISANPIKRGINGLPNDPRSLYPGPDEERIEIILRKLAVPGNINFDSEDDELYFSLTEFALEHARLFEGPELTGERIDRSLTVLFDSRYIIERNGKEFYFAPFEKVECYEREGELYYLVVFTSLFFNRGNFFDRIFEGSESKKRSGTSPIKPDPEI
jgi:hypothetical protein